jgi:hypothetical protein
VELSFKYPFLQNAIFAFSALYLLRTTPESRRFFAPIDERQTASRAINRELELSCPLPLTTIHELYLDLGLRQQRDAVNSLSSESANALFLSTVLHWYQAAPQILVDSQHREYAPPVQWLRMVGTFLSLLSILISIVLRQARAYESKLRL